MQKLKFYFFIFIALGLLAYLILEASYSSYVRQMELLFTENLAYKSKETLEQNLDRKTQGLLTEALEAELLKVQRDDRGRTLQFAFPVFEEGRVNGIIHTEKGIGFRQWFKRYGQKHLLFVLPMVILFAALMVFIYKKWIVDPIQVSKDRMVDDIAAKLREQIHRSDAMFKSMIDGVLAVDSGLLVLDYNQTMADRLRLDNTRSYKGKALSTLIRIPSLEEAVRQSLASREHVEVELRVEGEEGISFFLVHVSPLNFEHSGSSQLGALIVFHDITHVRRLEKIRTDFVANVSHELKTPLTSMRSIIEMLENKSIRSSEDHDKFLSILSRQGERLESIINDLLMLARIEEDENKNIELVRTRLKDVVNLAIQSSMLRAKAKKIEIISSIDSKLTALLHPALFEQALVNLITNAIDFSPESSLISIGAVLVRGQDSDEVEVFVKDQGPGIDPKVQHQIWHRFYRMDQSRNRKSGGGGLGLAIVKHIAAVHGGRVGLISQPGQGSIFKIFVRT